MVHAVLIQTTTAQLLRIAVAGRPFTSLVLQYFVEARAQHQAVHRWHSLAPGTQFVLHSAIESAGSFLVLHDNPPSPTAPFWLRTDDERHIEDPPHEPEASAAPALTTGDLKRRRTEAGSTARLIDTVGAMPLLQSLFPAEHVEVVDGDGVACFPSLCTRCPAGPLIESPSPCQWLRNGWRQLKKPCYTPTGPRALLCALYKCITHGGCFMSKPSYASLLDDKRKLHPPMLQIGSVRLLNSFVVLATRSPPNGIMMPCTRSLSRPKPPSGVTTDSYSILHVCNVQKGPRCTYGFITMLYLEWATSRFVVANVARAVLLSWGSTMVDRVPQCTSPELVSAVMTALPFLIPHDAIITAAISLLHDTVVKPSCDASLRLLQVSCG